MKVTPGKQYRMYTGDSDSDNVYACDASVYYSSVINSYSGSVYTHLH